MGDSPIRRWARTALTAALVTVAAAGTLVIGVGPAWAHNSLVDASPSKSEMLAEPPKSVVLKFLATLQPSARLVVTGVDGASAVAPVKVDGKSISAPFTSTAPGVYTVGYQVSSTDGHEVTGSYTFTVTLGTSASAAAQATASAEPAAALTTGVPALPGTTLSATTLSATTPAGTTPATTTLATTSPATSTPATPTGSATPWWPYIVGGAVAGLLLGMVIAFVKRRRDQA